MEPSSPFKLALAALIEEGCLFHFVDEKCVLVTGGRTARGGPHRAVVTEDGLRILEPLGENADGYRVREVPGGGDTVVNLAFIVSGGPMDGAALKDNLFVKGLLYEAGRDREAAVKMLDAVLSLASMDCQFVHVDAFEPCIVAADGSGVPNRAVLKAEGGAVFMTFRGGRDFVSVRTTDMASRNPLALDTYERLVDLLAEGIKGGAAVAEALKDLKS